MVQIDRITFRLRVLLSKWFGWVTPSELFFVLVYALMIVIGVGLIVWSLAASN